MNPPNLNKIAENYIIIFYNAKLIGRKRIKNPKVAKVAKVQRHYAKIHNFFKLKDRLEFASLLKLKHFLTSLSCGFKSD